MKTILTLLACAFFTAAEAQDYCKDIKKEVSADKRSYEYASPYNAEEVTPLHVTRTIVLDADYPSDNFYLIFKITGDLDNIYTKNAGGEQVEKEEKKLVVEFDDKTQIVDDTVVVSHDFTDDKQQAIRYVYYPLTSTTAGDFSTKKIVKFSLAGNEKAVAPEAATAIEHYVKCIKDDKQ
jgi:hypothetical protein